MIANGRASETERIWVIVEGLINLRWLKIQSIPLGKLRGTECLFQLNGTLQLKIKKSLQSSVIFQTCFVKKSKILFLTQKMKGYKDSSHNLHIVTYIICLLQLYQVPL
jgi:hypothetical protein